MCVANEDDLAGGGQGTIGSGVESSLTILSPQFTVDPMLDETDWAELQARVMLTPDLSRFEAVIPDGPIETQVDPDNLGSLENPLGVYGTTPYTVLP